MAIEAHGDVRTDDWFWLRDKDDPAVIEHLEAENAYTEAAMAGTAGLQASLFEEIVARIEETDLSVPVRKGPWRYYSRTVEGSSYAIHCRRPVAPAPGRRPRTASGPAAASEPGTPPEDEQVLLDENQLAEGHDYFAVGNLEISPDHRWLAYSTDTTGGERYTMYFSDLATGGDVARDPGRHLLRGGVGQRQRHRLLRPGGRGHAPVPAVAPSGGDRPGRRHPGVRGGGRPLLPGGGPDQGRCLHRAVGLESKVTTEAWALAADEPLGAFSVIEPRRQGIEYSVHHDRGDPGAGRESRFLIVTNDGAEDFRLMEAPDARAGPERTGGR